MPQMAYRMLRSASSNEWMMDSSMLHNAISFCSGVGGRYNERKKGRKVTDGPWPLSNRRV